MLLIQKWGFTALGVCIVIIGAADLTTRSAKAMLGPSAAQVAFAPAITLQAPQGAIIPSRIAIPDIGVNTDVELVGKKSNGAMGTPKVISNVGWYSLGPQPGSPGNAVMDGHVNNSLTKAGVFANLSQLKKGQHITVSDASGRTLIYTVSRSVVYSATNAPLDEIFATTGPSQLVLITCEGDWVPSVRSFDKRLVVYATLGMN